MLRIATKKKIAIFLVFSFLIQLFSSVSFFNNKAKAADYHYDEATGKYHIEVPLVGADFNNPNPAQDNIESKTGAISWIDDNTAPINTFCLSNGTTDSNGVNNTGRILTSVEDAVYQPFEGAGCFQFGDGVTTPINLIYKVEGLEVNATYRLSAKLKLFPGITTARGGNFGVKNYDTANYTTAGASQYINLSTLTTEWKEYSVNFTPTYSHAKIYMWGGAALPKVLVDNIKLEKVLDTEPTPAPTPSTTPKPTYLINGGDFEQGSVSVETYACDNKIYSTNLNYEVTNSDKKSGTYSLKFGHKNTTLSETIGYLKTDLKPATKYRINFSAKVGTAASKLSFRISGYKNNIPNDKSDIMNYIEHTEIKNTAWSSFHYDFETGASATKAFIDFSTLAGSVAFIDDLSLEEIGPAEPSITEPKVSRGNQLFIDKGLQIQAWTPTDEAYASKSWMKYPSVERVLDLGLTALQYNDAPNYNSVLHDKYKQYQQTNPTVPDLKWGIAWGPNAAHISSTYFESAAIAAHDAGKTGAPTKSQIENGFLTPEQLNNVNNLNNICFGDEDNYSDTLTQILKDWFDVSKRLYPNTLVHHNEVGNTPTPEMSLISTFNENMLRKYVRTAKPDFITYDMYYWRESRQAQEVGGTVIPFYDDLNRYRKIAAEGYDGTGKSPIPYGKYMQAWRTGPGAATPEKRGDGWYEMTESQLYLEGFANWTFGAKWLSIFRWIEDTTGYLFTDSRVDENGNTVGYHIYDQFKEMIRQSKNLGEHLVHINNTDVVILPGEHKDNEAVVKNNKPAGNAEWTKENDKAFIDNINVKNMGPTNNGLDGDVFVGYFEPIPGIDTTKFFTTTAPKYFMLLNGLTSGDGLPAEEQMGSCFETKQELKVTFDLSSGIDPTKLRKVSRLTGEIVNVDLKNLGNGKYELDTVIGGGMADLYFWELGSINAANLKTVGVEAANDPKLTGEIKYAKNREIRDLTGKTITVGWIKDTYNPIPQSLVNIGFTYSKDSAGKLLPMKAGDIGAYHTRDFELDMWNRRVARIQKDTNVTLKFVADINWTKEELMTNINKVKAGEEVTNMPDILVVPDEWTWNGLIKNNMIIPASQFNTIDFSDRKWNKSYINMSTLEDKTYGMYAGPTLNSTGLFVNKPLLTAAGVTDDLATLQQNGTWDWNKLKEIVEKFKNNPNVTSKYVFADTDELLMQMAYSNNAAPTGLKNSPSELGINSESFKEASQLYSDMYAAGLIMPKPENVSDDYYIQEFSKGNILFMAMPYNTGVEKLKVSYKIQDAKVEMVDGTFLGMPAKVPAITDVNDIVVPAGEYTMNQSNWVFLMFPKGPKATSYNAIIENPSYPVMLSSTSNPSDAAYIWNLLSEEYTGVPYDRFLKTYLNQRSADMNTLKRIGLKEGVWNAYEATGVWQNIIKKDLLPALKEGKATNELFEKLNFSTSGYMVTNVLPIGNSPSDPDEPSDSVVPSTPTPPVIPEKNIETVKIPSDIGNEKALSVKVGKAMLNISADILKKFDSLGANLEVTLKELSNVEADGYLKDIKESKNSTMKPKSELYEFGFDMVKGTEHQEKIKLEEKINIELPVTSTYTDANKLGMYRYNELSHEWDYVGGTINKETGKIIFKTDKPGLFSVMEFSKTYDDIQGHWAQREIELMSSKYVIKGMSDISFSPEENITRAEFAAIITRALELDTSNYENIFKDISSDDWFAKEVQALFKAGIVQGNQGSFRPNDFISREEMAVMIVRAFKMNASSAEVKDGLSKFTDKEDVSSWAADAVSVASKLGILNGVSDSKFAPAVNLTRAQAAAVLKRILIGLE